MIKIRGKLSRRTLQVGHDRLPFKLNKMVVDAMMVAGRWEVGCLGQVGCKAREGDL